jgi:type IV fimbrial biogenesis protein FimT
MSRFDRSSARICRSSEKPGSPKTRAYIPRMNRQKQHGFTLYELLITLLVIGVVLTLGVPNLGDFTRNSRITGTANDLHSSFMVGRSEAARSKSNVTICASADPEGAAICNGGSFDEGWIIFVDINGDLERAGLNENVLRIHPPVDDNIDVITNGGATYFSFSPAGLGRGNVGGETAVQIAMICDERGNEIAGGGSSAARRIVVTPIGRSVVIRDKDQIDASIGVAGVPC